MEADFSDNGAEYEEGEEAPSPSDGGATPVQDERDFGSDSDGEQPEGQPYKRSAPGPGSESGEEEGEDRDDDDDGDDAGQALSRSHSDEGERSDDGERYEEGDRESVDGDRDSPEVDRDSGDEAEELENEEREEGERTDSESEAEGAGGRPRPYKGAAEQREAVAADSDRESRSSGEEVVQRRSDEEEEDAHEEDAHEEDAHEEEGRTAEKRKADAGSEDEEGEVDKSPVKRSRVVSDNEEEDSDREFEPKRPEPVAESGSGSEDEAPRSSPPPAKRGRLISDDEDEAEPAETRNDDDHLEADRDGDDSGVEEGGAAVPATVAAAAAAAAVKRRRGSDSESDAGDGEDGGGEEAEGKPAARRARVVSDSDDDEAERKDERRVEQEAPARKAIVSDSEDDEDGERRQEKEPPAKKAILSDSEEEDDERQAEREMPARKPKVMDSDSESGSDDPVKGDDEKTKTKEKQIFGSDSDSADEAGVGILIADIFGDSDNEEEEFTGFGQEELEKETSALGKDPSGDKDKESESDSDEGVRRGNDTEFISDFDMMLQRKRELNRKQRRGHRDGGTFISDADDLISAMITRMNEAAEEDKKLNTERKPALKKMVMLPTVIKHLRKQDLVESFIDSGILSAIRDWLCPLPDKSLPNLKIREELLKVLQDLPSVPQETLKSSGIGRSVMYLYKHPKETRQNKDLAGKLINEWSRPIFGLTSNYKGMSREEREQRDLEQMPHRRRLSTGGQTPRRDLDKVLTGEEKALRPGDPGFCSRARVPMPSNRDYVIRPKWNVEVESNRGSVKKGINRVEKQMKKFADKRRSTKGIRAVKISVEGNHMPL
ncbi:uncharacterized protein LOC144734463 isoform X3 [Lampetra planeri]